MRSKTRSLLAVLAGLGLSAAALTMMLGVSGPVVANLSDAVGGARSAGGLVGAWQHRTASVLTGKADRILRWAQCPLIQNGSGMLAGS